MAKLKAYNRKELFRMSKEKDLPSDECLLWERQQYSFLSDGSILQKRTVIFKADVFNREPRRHDYSWKVNCKVPKGKDINITFEKAKIMLINKGFSLTSN